MFGYKQSIKKAVKSLRWFGCYSFYGKIDLLIDAVCGERHRLQSRDEVIKLNPNKIKGFATSPTEVVAV